MKKCNCCGRLVPVVFTWHLDSTGRPSKNWKYAPHLFSRTVENLDLCINSNVQFKEEMCYA